MTTRGSALLVLALAIGCGGSPKPASEGAASADPAEGDCEPGRCMRDIAERLEPHRPAARACYLAGHERDPSLQGTIVINYEIDPDGNVVDASQSTRDEQIMDTAVIDCIIAVVREVKFGKSARGKSTRGFHRYEFSPP